MMHLENSVRRVVHSMLSRLGRPRWGIVVGVNPANATATVMLQPDGILTGWLPIKGLAAGPVHVVALPSPGDQVQVHPDGGDAENLVISMASWGGSRQPPTSPVTGKPAQSGEFLIQIGPLCFHMTGGNVNISGGNLVVTNGSISATGNITAGQGTSDQVDLQGHTHGYLPGSGSQTQTSAPTAGT